MCGRYSFVSPLHIFEGFGLAAPGDFAPHYNIAPGQDSWVLFLEEGVWSLRRMRWGLIPHWAKDASIGYKTINARAETVAEKPAYRDAFRKRRCLVPADGFYEWKTVPGQRLKTPLRFTLKDEQPFLFAGLWSRWTPAEGDAKDTFTIVTAAADETFSPIHERCPVILTPEAGRKWTDMKAAPPDLLGMLKPFPSSGMKGYEVSRAVNAAANDVPEVLQPAGAMTWP